MYFRINERLGEPQPTCEAAEHTLYFLGSSLKSFKKEVDKTYPDPERLKKLQTLVVNDAQRISDGLKDYIGRGCCDQDLKGLEAQVQALPWTFQKTRGTKVVRIEKYGQIVRAHADLIKAIQDAQRTAKC